MHGHLNLCMCLVVPFCSLKQEAIHRSTELTLCTNALTFSLTREMSEASPNYLGIRYNSWAQITTFFHNHFQNEIFKPYLSCSKCYKKGTILSALHYPGQSDKANRNKVIYRKIYLFFNLVFQIKADVQWKGDWKLCQGTGDSQREVI